MKIGILTQYYPPEVGAPQARLSHLTKQLVQRGHQVSVLTAMPNYPQGRIHPGYGGLWRRDDQNGLSVVRSYIYPTQSAGMLPRLTNYFSFVCSSSVVGGLALPHVDYLMTESPPLFLGLSGYLLSRLKRARWIFNVSDLWPESAVRVGVIRAGTCAHRVSQQLEAFCYRHAWLVTGQSKSILADISARYPRCRTFLLSNGADSARFHPERHTPAARQVLTQNGACVALYAGLHGLAQGLDQVLTAASHLRGDDGLQFVLVGDGPERQRLLEQADQLNLTNVRFLDSRPADEIPALLASADVILVTLGAYIPGAVPSKLYEAMASGRPVVLVARDEAAQIVRDCQAGIAVEPGDVDGLVRALQCLQSNPQLRRTFGENGRRAAEQSFDRTKIATRFIDHLESSLNA